MDWCTGRYEGANHEKLGFLCGDEISIFAFVNCHLGEGSDEKRRLIGDARRRGIFSKSSQRDTVMSQVMILEWPKMSICV